MKYVLSIIIGTMFLAGCQQKVLSGKELEEKLKTTMTDYLHKTMKPGTEVTIKDLTYYADKERKFYICSFNVNVKSTKSDTTGTMKAFITNDFNKVTRTE